MCGSRHGLRAGVGGRGARMPLLPLLLLLLAWTAAGLHPRASVRRSTRAAAATGVARLAPTPHGLRHGGASHDHAVRARHILAIQRRGRWRSFDSVRRYEKHGRLALQLRQLPRALTADRVAGEG